MKPSVGPYRQGFSDGSGKDCVTLNNEFLCTAEMDHELLHSENDKKDMEIIMSLVCKVLNYSVFSGKHRSGHLRVRQILNKRRDEINAWNKGDINDKQ